jgi:hypothetical protein
MGEEQRMKGNYDPSAKSWGRGTNQFVQITNQGALEVAQVLPPYAQLARKGGGWSVMATAAVAALVVRPTTVAAVTLFNDEQVGGKHYVIDRLFTHNLVSTAAQTFFGMWACVHPSGMTQPTADITAFKSNSGVSPYPGRAVCDVGANVDDDGWFPWSSGQEVEATGVLPGSHISVDVQGRLIVPPQGGISLQVVAGVVGDTFTSGLSWYEVQLDT